MMSKSVYIDERKINESNKLEGLDVHVVDRKYYFVLEYVFPPLSSVSEYGMYNCAEADTLEELEKEFKSMLRDDFVTDTNMVVEEEFELILGQGAGILGSSSAEMKATIC